MAFLLDMDHEITRSVARNCAFPLKGKSPGNEVGFVEHTTIGGKIIITGKN